MKARSDKSFHVLLIDDDPGILDVIANTIRGMGYHPLLADGGGQAMELLALHGEDVIFILSDMRMPGADGLKIRQMLWEKYRDIPFAIVSGYVDRELALKAVDLQICAFLDKPIDDDQLIGLITEKSRDRVQNIEERRMLEQSFIEESQDILEELEPLLLSLEVDPQNLETVNTVFRYVHTIKGASGVMGRDDITTFLHSYEDLLTRLKNREVPVQPAVIAILIKGYDQLGLIIQSLARHEKVNLDLSRWKAMFRLDDLAAIPAAQDGVTDAAARETTGGGSTTSSSKKDSILVPSTMLDEFMMMSGEITVIRNMVNKLVVSIEKKLPRDEDINLLGELLEEMHKINGGMQVQIAELRKIPMASVFRKVPRAVRDLAKGLGKSVKVDIDGEQVRVDAAIAQGMNNCLIHMIRNSLDHGIETPDVRKQRGKNPEGVIRLACREENDEVIVTLSDDGGGLDPDKIREKLVSKGLFTDEAVASMPVKTVLHQIFLPGFSTAATVTDVSGRGVGMDMVMSTVLELKGRVDVDSQVGQGTQFNFRIPVPKSVTIINSLIIRHGTQCFAIPQDNIVRLLRLGDERLKQDVSHLEGSSVLKLDGGLLPLVNLSQLLQIKHESADDVDMQILIVNSESGRFALAVDEILDAEDIVVKPLHRSVDEVGAYAGATFLGDGSVGLILDIPRLTKRLAVSKLTEIEDSGSSVGDTGTEGASVVEDDYLLFELDVPGLFCLPLDRVFRLEDFDRQQVKFSGGRPVLIYRDQIMPLIDVASVMGLSASGNRLHDGEDKQSLFVVRRDKGYFGLWIRNIVDVTKATGDLDTNVSSHPGVLGVMIVNHRTATVIDEIAIIQLAGFRISEDQPSESGGYSQLSESTGLESAVQTSAGQDSNHGIKSEEAAGWGMF